MRHAAVGPTVTRRRPTAAGSLLHTVLQKDGAPSPRSSMKKPAASPKPKPLQITLSADGRLAKVTDADNGRIIRSPRQLVVLQRTPRASFRDTAPAHSPRRNGGAGSVVPDRTVLVEGIPPKDGTANSVRHAFRKLGEVTGCDVIASSHINGGIEELLEGASAYRALVTFAAEEDAARALRPETRVQCGADTTAGWAVRSVAHSEMAGFVAQFSKARRDADAVAQPALRAGDKATAEGPAAQKKKKKKKCAESLMEKLEIYEVNKRRLEKMATSAVEVGEKCEVYSESAGGFVAATVISVRERGETDAGAEYLDEVEVQYVGSDGGYRKRWVGVTSSEFKRGIITLKQAAAGDTDEFRRKRQRYRIGPKEKRRARAVLMRVPETRKADAVKEMVAWTYCADIFHGLSDKQRRQICLEARGEAVEENGTLISVGQDAPGIKVIMEGECAIYTMRKMNLDTGNQSSREGPADGLRDKFQHLQRRTSMTVRRESSVVNQMGQLQHVPTVAERRRSVAVAMNQAEQASGSLLSSRRNQADEADGIMFPVRMVFSEGDSLGAQRTFHNMDASAVQREGYQKADHTVSALTKVTYMVLDDPQHIAMVEKAQRDNLQQKIELLSQVQNYTMHPRESLERMARHCRRVWFGPDDVVMKEGDKAEHVYYIVHGELNVIKDHGMPSQKSLTVIGRGEWWAQPPRPLSPVLLTLCLSAASATGAW